MKILGHWYKRELAKARSDLHWAKQIGFSQVGKGPLKDDFYPFALNLQLQLQLYTAKSQY